MRATVRFEGDQLELMQLALSLLRKNVDDKDVKKEIERLKEKLRKVSYNRG